MPDVDEMFGDAGAELTTLQKIRLLWEWAPFLALLGKVGSAKNNQAKGLAIVNALRWFTKKSPALTDDEALDHFENVIKSREGEVMVNFVAKLLGALK